MIKRTWKQAIVDERHIGDYLTSMNFEAGKFVILPATSFNEKNVWVVYLDKEEKDRHHKTTYMVYTINRKVGKGYSYAYDTNDEAVDAANNFVGNWDWDVSVEPHTYEVEEDNHHDCGDNE